MLYRVEESNHIPNRSHYQLILKAKFWQFRKFLDHAQITSSCIVELTQAC